jgi:hypothetical protein
MMPRLLSVLLLLVAANLVVADSLGGHVQGGMVRAVGSMLDFSSGGPMPSYSVTKPTPDTTLSEIRWPMCFGKHSAMLGSFCVPMQDETEAHDKRQSELIVDLQAAPGQQVTLFFFGDEDDAYGRFWKDAIANKSCDSMAQYAAAKLEPDSTGHVQGARALTGKQAHLWYVVAVDCMTRQCPNVSSVDITFKHPGSDGSHSSCAPGTMSLAVLKQAMRESWSALSIRNVLQVVGITQLSVVILYLSMSLLVLLCSALMVQGCSEQDLNQRELIYMAFFVVCISAVSYLSMATGNGLVVLRKSGLIHCPFWRLGVRGFRGLGFRGSGLRSSGFGV